jgi:hypothetical protein
MKYCATLIAICTFLLAINTGCKKKNTNYCQFVSPDMVFVNFSEEETDTIIIRKYEKGSHYQKMIDTVLLPKADISRKVIGKDSIILASKSEKFHDFQYGSYGYDWEIILPGVKGFPLRAYDIVANFTQASTPAAGCQSHISSMLLGEELYTWEYWFPEIYRVYITRLPDMVE